ncbi:hypothetical protein KWV16_07835 [Clostridioides difficile]|nr:hypothetical protein [Clostridioides difficile]
MYWLLKFYLREIEEIFNDCDDYEVRILVDILKYTKKAICKDRKVRSQFNI